MVKMWCESVDECISIVSSSALINPIPHLVPLLKWYVVCNPINSQCTSVSMFISFVVPSLLTTLSS